MLNVEEITTQNHSSRQGCEVEGIILHFTAGGDIDGTIDWFQNPESKVSAHYVISRSGRIVQMVDEARAAWHAGSSTTTPKLNGKKNLNLRTIGIEICNWGWLYEAPENQLVTVNNKTYERKAGGYYTRLRKWTYPYKGPRPMHAKIESKVLTSSKKNPFPGGNVCYWWEPYTASQVVAVKELVLGIVTRRNHITREWTARHQDVDQTRKLDTGPAMNLDSIFDYCFPKVIIPKEIKVGKEDNDTISVEEMRDSYEPRTEKKWGCFHEIKKST